MANATEDFGQADQEVFRRFWPSRLASWKSIGEEYMSFVNRCECEHVMQLRSLFRRVIHFTVWLPAWDEVFWDRNFTHDLMVKTTSLADETNGFEWWRKHMSSCELADWERVRKMWFRAEDRLLLGNLSLDYINSLSSRKFGP